MKILFEQDWLQSQQSFESLLKSKASNRNFMGNMEGMIIVSHGPYIGPDNIPYFAHKPSSNQNYYLDYYFDVAKSNEAYCHFDTRNNKFSLSPRASYVKTISITL